MTALLAAISALSLVVHPTWGEIKNPGLWMFAILAALAGVARGGWWRTHVDHSWRLVGRAAAVLLRSGQQPQSDQHGPRSPTAER